MGIVWFYDRQQGKGWSLATVICDNWPLALKITVYGRSEQNNPWSIELDRFLLVWLN